MPATKKSNLTEIKEELEKILNNEITLPEILKSITYVKEMVEKETKKREEDFNTRQIIQQNLRQKMETLKNVCITQRVEIQKLQ